jgi:hypothetical protein
MEKNNGVQFIFLPDGRDRLFQAFSSLLPASAGIPSI